MQLVAGLTLARCLVMRPDRRPEQRVLPYAQQDSARGILHLRGLRRDAGHRCKGEKQENMDKRTDCVTRWTCQIPVDLYLVDDMGLSGNTYLYGL